MKVNFSRFSVNELRTFLIQKEYDEEEVNSRKKLDLVDFIQSEGLGDELVEMFPDEEETDEVESNFEEAELDADITGKGTDAIVNQVRRGTPEWNEYVLSLFTEDEYVEIPVDGGSKKIKAVKCEGLRRVADFLFGIVISKPEDSGVHYPDYTISKASDLAKLHNPPFAWVRYVVVFEDGQTWGGCADVNFNNIDPKFLPFAFSTAETRAEARALRKALRIKILAAEEFTPIDTAASVSAITTADWSEGEITDQQKGCIDRMCKKLGISVYKLINCQKEGTKVYFDETKIRNNSIDDLTNKKATGVITMLNELQQNKLTKDESLVS